jgi:hypothetical protein
MEALVVLYRSRLGTPLCAHERQALAAVAEAIAYVTGLRFDGSDDCERHRSHRLFFVPDDSLMAYKAAGLGIRGADDFYGGIVPHSFVKTKAISHDLVGIDAARLEGWSAEFAERVRHVVLPGYTVFAAADARIAASRLMPKSAIRAKKSLSAGARGQKTIRRFNEMENFLKTGGAGEMALYGLVLESELSPVTTPSVGEVVIAGLPVAYHGTQRLATDNAGKLVYGGSDLICVRGGWEALERLPMPGNVRLAVRQARHYDECMSAYPGHIASRRNYDIGQGIDLQAIGDPGFSKPRGGPAAPARLNSPPRPPSPIIRPCKPSKLRS